MNSINNTESAGQIGYNNSVSGLTATDVQGALDEVASGLGDVIFKSLSTTRRFFTDFDTAIDGGLYVAPNYKAFNASPQSTSDDSCMLLVLKNEPYVVQICISTYRFNTIYIRRRLEITWSAWKSISLA